MKFKLLLILIVIYYISSCSNDNRNSAYSPFLFSNDTISYKLKYSESNFTIPSPGQIAILIKECKLAFNENLVLKPGDLTKTATTTARRSIAVGFLGADLNYINLYDQKALAFKNIAELKNLMNELEIGQSIDKSVLKKIENNYSNNDTIFNLLSQIYRSSDQYLKDNDQRDISSLIIAGGWIESFYCLTQLYSKTKRPELYQFILYQMEVIDNLIKILSPFYEKSIEYANLVDDLVNLAYEFDIMDLDQSVIHVTTDSISGITKIHNQTNIKLTGSKLDLLIKHTSDLRNKLLL